jgi:oxalate---CoA ligase
VLIDSRLGDLVEPLTGRRWDSLEINRRIAARAQHLIESGIGCADKVMIVYGNNLEFFVDLIAVWWVGGCAVPVDARLTAFEVETLAHAAKPGYALAMGQLDGSLGRALESADVKVLDGAGGINDGQAALPPSPLHLDDPALILFTSGTTGDPKGVVHTHRSLRARWTTLAQSLGLHRYRRTLCLLPTHFGHGLICNCLFPWLYGADLYIVPPFRADIITGLGDLLDRHKITFLSSVPSVWRLALKMAKPPSAGTLERVHCGSAPLSEHMWKQVCEWTGTPEIFNAYGITETGSWVAGTTVEQFEPEDGLIGRPWGAAIRILKEARTDIPPAAIEPCGTGEQGYVWLNTPALMKGYLNRDDLTREVVSQGWFMTGDIGLLDDRGLLYLRGREREEINKGGMKVYPGDVDGVVEQFANINDVCTFAVEDPLYGQNVGIAVVVEGPVDETISGLRDFMLTRLAAHQMPIRWYLVDEIPRTSRGKVNRARVSEVCAGLPVYQFRVS